jgi:hypothetical protein
VPNRGPSDFCGTAGWFPGYPFASRAVAKLGFDINIAMLIVSRVFLALLLALLWFGFLQKKPFKEAVAPLALACVFPGSVYYLALFPMAMAVFFLLLMLWGIDRNIAVVTAIGSLGAAFTYPVAALAGLVASTSIVLHPQRRAAIRTALGAAGGSLVGLGSFFAILQFRTGHWDAYFRAQAGYHHKLSFPLVNIYERVSGAIDPADPVKAVPSLQHLLVLCLVIALITSVIRVGRWPSVLEFTTLAVVVVMYLASNVFGLTASVYRHESLLLPIVLVAPRLRTINWFAVIVAFVVSCQMTLLFFTFKIF